MTATDQVIPYYVKRETTQVRVTVRDVTGFLFDTSTINGATWRIYQKATRYDAELTLKQGVCEHETGKLILDFGDISDLTGSAYWEVLMTADGVTSPVVDSPIYFVR